MTTCRTNIISGSGTLLPSGGLIPGSTTVYYTYEIPCASSYINVYSFDSISGQIPLQVEPIGEPTGVSPLDIGTGLLAWHKLGEFGNVQYDYSDNNLDAIVSSSGNVSTVLAKTGYGKKAGPEPYGYINAPIPQQHNNPYMISFWMKPNELLTSGVSNNFILFKSDVFDGDHFEDVWDYTQAFQYKGWTEGAVGEDFVTCSAGYQGTYLLAKGASSTNWVTGDYTASTLYFEIDKEEDWDIEASFTLTQLTLGQGVGFIFTNNLTLADHCTLLLEGDGGGVVSYDDRSPTMTSNTTPSPWSISSSNSEVTAYKAFDNVGNIGTRKAFNRSVSNDGGTNYLNASFRIVIPSSQISQSGNKIRIYFEAGKSNGNKWDHISFARRSSGANATDTPTPLTFGGSNSLTLSAYQHAWSDWIDFDIESSYDHLIIFDCAGFGQYVRYNSGIGYRRYDYDSWNLQNVSGFVAYNYQIWIEQIEVRDTTVTFWETSATLPQAISLDYTEDYKQLVNAYRWANSFEDDRKSPRAWTIDASNINSPDITNDDHWTQLDYRGNYDDPGIGEWTEYFTFTNYSEYKHYRMKVTEVNTVGSPSHTLQIAEIELCDLTPSPYMATVKIKTADLSYDDIPNVTIPNDSGNYLFQMHKRSDTIKFYFKDHYKTSIDKVFHEFDCSLWGSSMLIGLQTRNESGESPLVKFDYVEFKKGIKPQELGDATPSGRMLITYNEVDVEGVVEERTDSRFWGFGDKYGPAYGTATFYWNPDEWYLMQFGMDPVNNEMCWWVNGKKERGLLINDNYSVQNQIISSGGVNYFDTATSGMVVLDEVSHWDRWLGVEEILKLINKVSQAAWFFSTDYLQFTENIYSDTISLSGSYGIWNWKLPYYIGYTLPGHDAHAFKLGLYQKADTLSEDVNLEAISYRIQREATIYTRDDVEAEEKIVRCSSGWIANNLGCYSCPEHAVCQCDVRADLSFYSLGYGWLQTETVDLYNYFGYLTDEIRHTYIDISIEETYRARYLDFEGPSISNVAPARNQIMVDPSLSDMTPSGLTIETSDYGGTIDTSETRFWIKRNIEGYDSNGVYDNFSYYNIDFKNLGSVVIYNEDGFVDLGVTIYPVSEHEVWGDAVSTTYGWGAVNVSGTESMEINDGFMATVSNTLTSVSAVTINDIERDVNYMTGVDRYTTRTYVYGTNSFDISQYNEANWSSDYNAPFAYWDVPSGIDNWQYVTRVRASFNGESLGQETGIMLTYPDDPTKFIALLVTSSGILARTQDTLEDSLAVNTGLMEHEPVWLKVDKQSDQVRLYYSVNGVDWNAVMTQYSGLEAVSPANMTSNNSPSPYVASASANYGSSYYPYKSFDGNNNTTWRSRYNCPEWIKLDFGENVFVTHFRFRTTPGVEEYISYEYYQPCDFSLQVSTDNSNWITQYSKDGLHLLGHYQWSDLMQLSSPMYYRYFKFNISKVIFLPYEDPPIESSSFEVQLYGLEYWGPTTKEYEEVSLDKNMRVGPVVFSNKWHTPLCSNPTYVTPEMTSYTSPSPYEVDSSYGRPDIYPAWAAFNPPTALFDNAKLGGEWISLKLDKPRVLIGWKFYGRQGYQSSSFFSWLPGVGDNKYHLVKNRSKYLWYRLRGEASAYSATCTVYFEASNDFSNWNTLSTSVFTDSNANYISRCTFLGFDECEYTPQFFDSSVDAKFHYIKFISDTALPSSFRSGKGDDWELLVFGEGAINSSDNTGVTSYNEIDGSPTALYRPKEEFGSGERVYVRTQFSDTASFKLDYIGVSSELTTMLYLDNNTVSGTRPQGTYPFDSSIYNRDISFGVDDGYSYESIPFISSEQAYQGTASLKFDGHGYISSGTPYISKAVINGSWTLHCWVFSYETMTSSELFSFYDTEGSDYGIKCVIENDYIKLYKKPFDTLHKSIGPLSLQDGEWTHIAIVKEGLAITIYKDGLKYGSTSWKQSILVEANSEIKDIGFGHVGFIDEYVFESKVKWTDNFVYGSRKDEITSFKIISLDTFSVDIFSELDTHAPVVLPVSPQPMASGVCPASGIVFDILDDFTGVNWDRTVVTVDGITSWSGGADLSDFYWDRGNLTWEDRGQQDGEWLGMNPDFTRSSGVNQLLYPPGTVYSGSGAWGRRLEYHVPDATQIAYFGKRINVHIEGQDYSGKMSEFDDITPNEFSYDYYFDMIPNDNIQFGNFWLQPGESERIDILTAKDRYFIVDMWDTNYPTTDIVEEESGLTMTDGVRTVSCSGIWFTTYTGTGGLTPSGVPIHRMHYNPENDYNWTGHRTLAFTVRAYNDDPLCDVYNEVTYKLNYGWQLYWHHSKDYDPFEFNKHLPVFIAAKTYEFVPSNYAKSYMIWTSPGYTQDFSVHLKIPPKPYEDLGVGILAQSQYLQYSEDVTVEIECKDLDGNELNYSWTFTTEDKPQD